MISQKTINFCHIHVHSTYSVLDGLGTPNDYAKKASEMGFEYLACTDHGNIDGLIKWQKACLNNNIKPILGSELYIVPDARIKTKEKRGHILLLCKNTSGWKTLCHLLTYANLNGFYYKPRIDYKSLLESDLSGLVITTACAGSFIHLDGGLDLLYKLNERIPDDLFLEIMPHNIDSQKAHNKEILDIHSKTGIPLVGANDAHYVNQNEWRAQEVLLAIQTKDKWSNPARWRFGFEGLYLRSYSEMIEAFKTHSYLTQGQILSGLRNTIKIGQKCGDFRISKKPINLPLPEKYKGNPDDVLHSLIEEEKVNILKSKYINEIEYDEYRNRIDYEFDIIKQKGFCSYILIIKDFMDWCKENDIMCGPGRGSAAGSLISFILGITKIDPIKYGLLFERFVALDRADLPDIDIDVQDNQRDKAKAYFERVYGHTNIAGISTFNSMKSRGVIRDVCRVFDIPYEVADSVAKAIDPKDENGIQDAVENNDIVKNFNSQYPGIVELSLVLEGQVRAGGQHAAGLVVSDEDLYNTDKCNLCVRSGQIVVNWDKDDAEYMGLIKIDILGIKTLTVLKGTQELIYQNYKKKIDFNEIPLEDDKVFKELSNGKTTGVFQLNTGPTTKLTQDIGVRYFMDISDILALVRPGPYNSGTTAEYIQRKQDVMKNKYWVGKHRIYEEITKDSYGQVIYQEQIIHIISKLAGLPFSVADKIRKIIGKKRDSKEFEPYWKMFLEGCLEHRTMDEDEAEIFWHGLQEWSAYGFAKAHSVGYSVISMWTAWFKTYYPLEFFCALLTYGAKTNMNEVIAEIRRMGFDIAPPEIGISDSKNWIAKNNKLYIPFMDVKGIGDSVSSELSLVKQDKPVGFLMKSDINAPVINPNSKVALILNEIKEEVNNGNFNKIQQFFDFNIGCNYKQEYPHLYSKVLSEVYPNPDEIVKDYDSMERIIKGEHIILNRFIKRVKKAELNIQCSKCELFYECTNPVSPSFGKYNIMIIGECPGKQEDYKKIGFIGKAGTDVLWPELKLYGLKRELFYVSNVCKCFPSKTKTPKIQHINICKELWLNQEIKYINPILILALGKTPLLSFTGEESGIMKKSGTTEWIDELSAWVCWCIHPASVLYNSKNRVMFEQGIRNFVNKIPKEIK